VYVLVCDIYKKIAIFDKKMNSPIFITTCAAAFAFLILALLLMMRCLKLKAEIARFKESLDKSSLELEQRVSALTEFEANNEKLEKDLKDALKTLKKQETQIEKLKEELNADSFDGRFPICSQCKDIRDSIGYWHPIEEYLQGLSDADFSHSLCPNCAKELYPDMFKDGAKPHTLTWK